MVRKKERSYASEFPVLDELNLYASATKGDGNCLFRALSDQLYGDESHHSEIRQNIMNYVEQNGDHFAAFVGEFGETFDQYLYRLRQDGVYGGDIEITGFADYYNKAVVIYQADSLYVIQPRESAKVSGSVHLAYHTWEHYSSVRKTGNTSGPVEIELPKSSIPLVSEAATATTDVPSWQVDLILKSVPDVEESKVVEMLRTKDTDTVIEELLVAQYEEPEVSASTPEATPQKDAGVGVPSDPVSNEGTKEEKENTQNDSSDKNDLTTSNKGEIQKPEEQAKPTETTPKLNRRELARQRRQDKKERVRQKKTKQTGDNAPKSDPKSESEQAEILAAKVMYI